MYNLFADINRRFVEFQRFLDGGNSTIDASAITARSSQQYSFAFYDEDNLPYDEGNDRINSMRRQRSADNLMLGAQPKPSNLVNHHVC